MNDFFSQVLENSVLLIIDLEYIHLSRVVIINGDKQSFTYIFIYLLLLWHCSCI